MGRKNYNKLVRDNIPDIIQKHGGVPEVMVLAEEEFRRALKAKMIEEANELGAAKTPGEVLNELSDLLELVEAIAKENHLSLEVVHREKERKKIENGSFRSL